MFGGQTVARPAHHRMRGLVAVVLIGAAGAGAAGTVALESPAVHHVQVVHQQAPRQVHEPAAAHPWPATTAQASRSHHGLRGLYMVHRLLHPRLLRVHRIFWRRRPFWRFRFFTWRWFR